VRTPVLLPIGAVLGLLGFVALAVEGLRVAIASVSLAGWQAVVPWAGLGLIAVGALLLVIAMLDGGDEPA
jgi:hypothetical protein